MFNKYLKMFIISMIMSYVIPQNNRMQINMKWSRVKNEYNNEINNFKRKKNKQTNKAKKFKNINAKAKLFTLDCPSK